MVETTSRWEDELPRTLARVIAPVATTSENFALTLQASWTAASGQVPTARRRGQVVQLEGLINPGTTPSSTVIAALPASMRPDSPALVRMQYGS